MKIYDDYNKVNEPLCWYCEYLLNVISDEGLFEEPPINKTHSFISYSINSVPEYEPPQDAKSMIKYGYVGNGKISCTNCAINQIDKYYPKFEIIKYWNLSEKSLTNIQIDVGTDFLIK